MCANELSERSTGSLRCALVSKFDWRDFGFVNANKPGARPAGFGNHVDGVTLDPFLVGSYVQSVVLRSPFRKALFTVLACSKQKPWAQVGLYRVHIEEGLL